MTPLLERAYQEIAKLADERQNEIATWLLEEIASEEQDTTAKAVADGLADMDAKRTVSLDEELVRWKEQKTLISASTKSPHP